MKNRWTQSGFYALCLTLFLLPFNPVWSRYSSALFLAFGLISWISGFGSYSKKIKTSLFIILPFVLYFLLHFIKYDNGITDWKLIERQLLFLLAPLFGYPVFRESFSRGNKSLVIISFISGAVTASLILLIRAVFIQNEILQPEPLEINSINAFAGKFMASALSFFQHPSYFSLGINISIVLLVLYGEELPLTAAFRWTLIMFLSVMIFLLSSRAGMLGLAISAVILIIMKLREAELNRVYLLGGSVLVILLIFLFMVFNPAFKSSVNKITENISEYGKFNLGEIEPRANVWSTAKELISDRIFTGYGVNEGKQKLINEYRNNGFYSEAFFTLNCHNQFLETQLAFGLTGTLLLIFMIFGGLFCCKNRSGCQIQILFIVLIITHFMFESMLVRQWGIMLFTFFCCILNLYDNEGHPEKIPSGV